MEKTFSRIMVFGRPGSGKSTFAYALHQRTGIPIYHLDRYFYRAQWIERDYQEFLTEQQELVDKNSWIIDGNCTKSLEMRFAKADIVLCFIYPRWLCYLRVFKRFFRKDRRILDRADGCAETIQWSLLSYMWSFETRVAEKVKVLRGRYPTVVFQIITSDKDLQKLDDELFSG